MTTIDRRRFLAATAGGLVWTGMPGAFARAGDGARRFLSCGADERGGYFAALIDADGRFLHRVTLPGRGHGFAVAPHGDHAVVFARRPGTFAVVVDLQTGTDVARITAAAGRHFYGHGAYTADGRILFASENDIASGDGVIGVYDAADGYKRVGAFASHGIGPHQIMIHPDGKTLVVANGGIRTDPAQGRAKLNLDTMAPNLTLVDPASGRVLETARLEAALHQLSIRHIDVNGRGDVAFAMQFQGDKRQAVPMLGVFRPNGRMTLLRAPAPVERHLRHYMGSVAFDGSGRVILASAPRGGLVVAWDGGTGEFLGQVPAADACGVAPADGPGAFLVTAGDGTVRRVDAVSGTVNQLTPPSRAVHWDNHVGVARA